MAKENVPLIGWPFLTSFSGNGRAKFSKELQKSGPQISRRVRQQGCTPLSNNRGQDVRQSHRSAQWADSSYSVASRAPGRQRPGWTKTTLRTQGREDAIPRPPPKLCGLFLLISQQRSAKNSFYRQGLSCSQIACIAVWAFFLSRYRQYSSARTATAPGGSEPVARAHESPALRVTERGQGERASDPCARLGHGNCRKHDVIAIAAGVID